MVNEKPVNSKVQVRRTGATWSVFVNGRLEHGGFFGRRAAESCAYDLRAEHLVVVADLVKETK